MKTPILRDAFAHNTWATIRILDACAVLTPEQLETTVPGTYGSILSTLRHTVGAELSYLFVVSGGAVAEIDEDSMGLPELRAAMAVSGPAWQDVIAGDLDHDADVVRHRDDGTVSHAPLGTRLAQVLNHGTDHRSQICTALTTLGIEPPEIDVWAFADSEGRISVTPAAS